MQKGTGAYRVRPSELGRVCEEDLSIAPNGIRDFGQQWDEPVGYTPVGLLQAYFHPSSAGELEPADFDENDKPTGTLSEDAACQWLAAQLDLNWDALRAEDAQIMFAEPPYGVEEFCNLDVREIRQRAADLALLKFGYWDRYNEVAARLEPGISRRELDQIVDEQGGISRCPKSGPERCCSNAFYYGNTFCVTRSQND